MEAGEGEARVRPQQRLADLRRGGAGPSAGAGRRRADGRSGTKPSSRRLAGRGGGGFRCRVEKGGGGSSGVENLHVGRTVLGEVTRNRCGTDGTRND